MKRQALQQNKGETIVEVVVAFALLLLFMSVLAGAIRFSAAAQQKAAAQADVNYKIATALRESKNPTATETKDYEFGFAGGTALFSMKAATTQTDVTAGGETYSFYRYQKAE